MNAPTQRYRLTAPRLPSKTMCFVRMHKHLPILCAPRFTLALLVIALTIAIVGVRAGTHVHAQDVAPPQTTDPATRPPIKIYLIGNSLTWDTLPGLLAGDVQWHVDCGKNLKYIYEHPAAPCVKTSNIWTEALSGKQYDILSVQPHNGTSLDEDVTIISHWLQMQPHADLVIHTGWNQHAVFEKDYHATKDHDRMIHAPLYFEKLRQRLAAKFPGRQIRSSNAIHVLDSIWHDIDQGNAPFNEFAALYRDNIHMTTQSGRYLMHNLMRVALNQPVSDQGFQIDKSVQEYLDKKIKHNLSLTLASESHE